MRIPGSLVGQSGRFAVIATVLCAPAVRAYAQAADGARWTVEAKAVTIVRDDWGIAHVHGKSDADAVFGMVYAQAEDDFHRVEMNYLTSLGRVAEAEGEKAIWEDLRQRLFVDPEQLKTEYVASPAWLKKLMDAWADGLNFYLAAHKEVKPLVLTHFEPWMALSFTEGSIGGDIERVDVRRLQAFYDKPATASPRVSEFHPVGSPRIGEEERQYGGSNGFAIAPANTLAHHALLLINPHTSFFFRSELQMTSDEGLNAYGAATWGQIFVYQGFNDRAGWMHTSSNVDAVDEYAETVTEDAGTFQYRYGGASKAFVSKPVTIRFKAANGVAERTFATYFSGHGPVVREDNGKWITVSLMVEHVKALEQSFLRTKARDYAEYKKTMELMANSSNNTIFADADGDIAYWHGNYIPRRDTRFDFTKPVDGSDPATSWKGLTPLNETPQLKNPASGWLFNVNDSPWNGAGASSLKKADFPAYVEQGTETARGVHAMRVLTGKKDFTLESLRAAAYDSYLPWFATTIPGLVKAYDGLPAGDAKTKLAEPIATLRTWDYRWGADSVATSVAVFWGETLRKADAARGARESGMVNEEFMDQRIPADTKLLALSAAVDLLQGQFGTWKTPWGKINRFQRLTGDIVQPFNDAGASIPVPFVSSLWGSLASFAARPYPGTKKWYGTSGNSFVAVVEFGDKVRARAVTAGGRAGIRVTATLTMRLGDMRVGICVTFTFIRSSWWGTRRGRIGRESSRDLAPKEPRRYLKTRQGSARTRQTTEDAGEERRGREVRRVSAWGFRGGGAGRLLRRGRCRG